MNQKQATRYYDRFSYVYDLLSSDYYYKKPRSYAIKQMRIKENQFILNIPCWTWQNFSYFNDYLSNTGKIIWVDISKGMLKKSKNKIKKYGWNNIILYEQNVLSINSLWLKENCNNDKFDSVLIDLGLSWFPEWQKIIDNMLEILKPWWRIVIMDWYIEKRSLRSSIIEYFWKWKTNRNIWQYLSKKVTNYKYNESFKNWDMFVASGEKN